jgi:hypothetical protein
MYVLTGATGGLGSQILKSLLNIVPANQIIVSLYNTSSSASTYLSSLGVTVHHGDYTSRNSPNGIRRRHKTPYRFKSINSRYGTFQTTQNRYPLEDVLGKMFLKRETESTVAQYAK